jgi:hypothetical protein
MPEVTPLLPALLSIISTVVTTLLELFGLEEEEEDGSNPLGYGSRPLYIGRGLVTDWVASCPAAGSSVAASFA